MKTEMWILFNVTLRRNGVVQRTGSPVHLRLFINRSKDILMETVEWSMDRFFKKWAKGHSTGPYGTFLL